MSDVDTTRARRASRHLPIAQAITGEEADKVIRKLCGQRVLLTGDPRRLRTATGHLMLRVAANLISRFCPAVDVCLVGSLANNAVDIRELILSIDRSAEIHLVPDAQPDDYAAVLSVGRPPQVADNLVAIDAAGWLAVVSNSGTPSCVTDLDGGNPFGAMAAAALGAAEVFKLLVKPRPERAAFFGDTTFSTFAYSVGSREPGPELRGRVILPPSLLAGVGGVGNAFLMALREVPGLQGELVVVDRELLGDPSNLNRYALTRDDDVRAKDPLAKTALATRLFAGTSVSIRELHRDVREIASEIERGTIGRPEVILSALDNHPSRHELQDLGPDLLLEGATGGTVLQVSRCDSRQDRACLRCLHPLEQCPTRSYEERICELSGLPLAWIAAAAQDPSLPLSAEVVAEAPQHKRESLVAHIGKEACRVIAEIEGVFTLAKDPSVSFVSMMSGVLMAAEYVKHLTRAESVLKTFFYADLMFRLDTSRLLAVKKRANCDCVRRRDVIARYRDALTASQGQPAQAPTTCAPS
jgi:molybdopterin/thiamine biosynthesis adenylyltransferase